MSEPKERTDVWTYDDFTAGGALGTVEVMLDARRLDLWNRVYAGVGGAVAPGDDAVPHGLVVAAMMEGFIEVIQPRPPGNIHAGQKLGFTGRPIRPGTRLSLVFTCLAKEIKRERRWLTFGVRILDGRRPTASGEISAIWAK